MLVVSDTSPLSNLAIIGRLGLLQEQFVEVLMTPAVAQELDALDSTSAKALLHDAIRTGWLKEHPLPESAPWPDSLRGLDEGETEAIRLVMSIGADGVLMDEKEGRRCAASLGIRTIGVLGILIAARQAGVLPSLRNEIEALRREAGFFIDPALELRVLTMVGE